MDYRSHMEKMLEAMTIALTKDKPHIIEDFRLILSRAGRLFKTDDFDYWLRQLGEVDASEVPMTKYGLREAKDAIESTSQLTKPSLESLLHSVCEQLFTYSNPNDVCPAQSDFHYYFHVPSQTIFKESQLGHIEPVVAVSDRSDVRIATVSQLSVNQHELVAG